MWHLGYSRRSETDCPFPESGTWRCDDLGITLYLDRGFSYIDDGEDQVTTSYMRESGSCELYINCNERNHPDYPFEYLFFSGDLLEITEDTFLIKCHKTRTVYEFRRISD